jgi:hypothetical protein
VSDDKMFSGEAVTLAFGAFLCCALIPWCIFANAWSIQTIASWHGYHWTLWQIVGYTFALASLAFSADRASANDRIKRLSVAKFGDNRTYRDTITNVMVKAIFSTILLVVVRFL